MLEEALEEYTRKRPKSRQLYEKSLRQFPGGVCHNIRTWGFTVVGAYPTYMCRAKGCHLWDVDGNEYVDNWMGHMALILGHTPRPVVNALREQLVEVGGTQLGTVNDRQVELAELVMEMMPSIEMLRFCNTGGEATMYAVRMARGYTGKRVIVKCFGGWHGFSDVLNWYVHEPYDDPVESLGQISELRDYVVPVHFRDEEETVKAIRRNRGNLAAVIFEIPMDDILDRDEEKVSEYLKAVREETEKNDILLILDEVITGFRLAPGGAQEYFNVKADLTALGKILGGGLPIGCIGGREEIMRLADPRDWEIGLRKKSEMVWIGGGTFSANPLTMIAGAETLKILGRRRGIYERLRRRGKELRKEFRKIFEENDLPIDVLGIQSCFDPKLTPFNRRQRVEWLIRLHNKGVFGHRLGGYLSAVHEDGDLKKYLSATRETVEEMKGELRP